MKKRNFKLLKLNKKSISHLQLNSVHGGWFTNSEIICDPTYTETAETCINTDCPGGVVCDLQTPTGKQ
ncbi:hypothetical protein H2O64_15550 [Kordia sp. YSTF-M3]|uniref:Uncharacterized protein n=1 Tax=Kordia aestuariivivens TaxID=2759037 RepID=A0ABR7QBY6_9FLAO|nr:hypothetical protein [Kordia aestuariivivens]MBC8756092.1 hypothetical protein [Kordia aestuariivivens]